MKKIHIIKHALTSGILLLTCVAPATAETLAPKVHEVSSENPVSGRDAVHTVDGSGLVKNTHAIGESGIAWTSLGNFGDTDYDPYITYDLGAACDVQSMHIWNYNSDFQIKQKKKNDAELSTLKTNMSVIGPDEVEVFTSADGKSYQSQGNVNLVMASGKAGYAGQIIKVDYRGVRYIKFDIKSTHEGTVFDGTGKNKGSVDKRALTGLSEVRFQIPSFVEYRVESERLQVTEGGVGAQYEVRLSQKPASGETIHIQAVPADRTLTLGGNGEGLAMELEFTRKNWNQWQKITVAAHDDAVHTVNHIAKIQHFVSRSSDSEAAIPVSEEVAVHIKDNDPEPPTEKLDPIDPAKRMEWFADIKYYWFIHWGPSSLAGTEISWSRGHVGVAKYDQLYKQFNPTEFDAEQWVRIAKAAGLKTMVLISKHHDGFCMWDTKTTDYNIMNTPFKRDVIKELSEACKKHGMRFSLYYSIMDWYHPDWPHHYAGGPGYQLPKGTKPDINRYFDYMEAQITELLTKYGDISLMWWDGTDGREAFAPNSIWGDKESARFEALCRKLQPAMVMNNRIGHWNGNDISKHWWVDRFGDYDSNEMERVQFQKTPWEYTWKLGDQWGYRPNDRYKSEQTMIRDYIVRIVGNNGNFLMNTAPTPTGKIEDRVVERLTGIGNWLKLHGESIYETRGGPYKFGASKWGVSTSKGNKVYLHILNWPNEKLILPPLGKKILSSSLLTGGTVKVEQTAAGLSIEVPVLYRKKIDTIVVLELSGDAMDIKPLTTQ